MSERTTRARRWSFAAIAVSLGVLFVQTSAHAIPMVYTATYALPANPAITISTEALFDTTGLSNTGTEYVPLTSFTMVFSQRGILQTADIILPTPTPWPDGTLTARYINGVFDTLWSKTTGGANRISVTPPSNWLGEGITLNHNELVDFPCCSGFTKYSLTTSSGPLPVPEPSAALLIGVGLAGLAIRRERPY